jgi:uncharacterized protein YjbI with pentapeptide repeats
MKTLSSLLLAGIAGLGFFGCVDGSDEIGMTENALTAETYTATADTYVMGNNSGGHGSEGIVVTRYTTESHRRFGLVRFDVPGGVFDSATLSLRLATFTIGNFTDSANIRIYGAKNGAASSCQEAFSESGLVYDDVSFHGNMLNSDGIYSASSCLTTSTPLVTKSIASSQVGQVINFTSSALKDFLRANTNSKVTFVITTDTLGPYIAFNSKENVVNVPPKISVVRHSTCGQLQADLADGVLSVIYRGAYLRSCDLHGADLTGIDLSEADLSKANLSGANLSGANLDHVYAYRTNLSGATITDADITYANLTNANLAYSDIKHSDLSYADLTNANLTYASLSETNLTNANFANANLLGAWFVYAKLINTNLLGADLTYIVIDGAHFVNTICADGVNSDDMEGTCNYIDYVD